MKRAILQFVIGLMIPFLGMSQTLENLEYISPFNDDVAAVKKNDQWAFINKNGDFVINFRNDLVTTKTNENSYPVFYNDRCLVFKETNGITYFGYIDKTGKTVIEPRFLNANNFTNNIAIALELVKEDAGKNELLNKNIVFYKYFEVVIDRNGYIKIYLNPKGINISLDKKFFSKPPKIKSKLISDNLIIVEDESKKWSVKRVNE